MLDMELILKAERWCEMKHKGQTRKVSGTDYAIHPMGVAYIAATYKKSKNLALILAACRLHDTVEDTETTFKELLEEFGMPVASLVYELTDDKEKRDKMGKLEYQKKKWSGMSNYALYIKFCDRLYNMSDNPTEAAIKMTTEILDYVEEVRTLTRSQMAVVTEIRKVIARRS